MQVQRTSFRLDACSSQERPEDLNPNLLVSEDQRGVAAFRSSVLIENLTGASSWRVSSESLGSSCRTDGDGQHVAEFLECRGFQGVKQCLGILLWTWSCTASCIQ